VTDLLVVCSLHPVMQTALMLAAASTTPG